MEYDMRSSTAYSMSPERLDFEKKTFSDSSSDEWSSSALSRYQRKCFWKGGDYADNTMNEALMQQNYPKRKIKSKSGTKAICQFIRKKIHDIQQYPFENGRTIIKLTNVPVKMNNILDLYHCFNGFGTISLIQAQRNSNPYCAMLSFLIAEDAKNAMENASKIIPNVRAVWFTDICLTTNNANYVYSDDMHSSENKNRCQPNDIAELSDKLNCAEIFNAGDRNSNISNNNMKYKQNLETLITELIRKKKRLLSHQMNSMREIIQKMNKCEIGSRNEKILSELLKKVQDQIHENRKSIEYSIKQRSEYFAKQKYLSYPKPVEKPTSSCPPWISAFKAALAKRTETMPYEEKRRKSNETIGFLQTASVISDDESSSSESEGSFLHSGAESSSKYSSNFRANTVKRPRKFHANVKDETYQCEMDHLLSDDSDVQDVD